LQPIKLFLNNVFGNETLSEITLRTLFVLIPSEGARVAFRGVLYKFMSKTKAKEKSEQFGFIVNIAVALAFVAVYAVDQSWKQTLYEGLAYGFTTFYIHYWIVKNHIGSKLGNGIVWFFKSIVEAMVTRIKGKKK